MSLLISFCSYLILRLYQKTRALVESEDTFRSAMQNAAIGMALVSPRGRWMKVNKAFCEMFGYSEKELFAFDFQAFTHPDDLNSDLIYIKKLLAHEINAYQIEKRYLHKSGAIIWALLNVSLVWHDERQPKYFIAQIQNISDRKHFEEANNNLLIALEKSNKELESFAYVASHDLQEPVRMINGFVDIILAEKQPLFDDETKEYLKIVYSAGERIKHMVQDLLAYSRVSNNSVTMYEFDLNDTVKEVLQNLNILITEHNAEISTDLLPRIKANPIQLMRLIQNLISNAIKYQPPGNSPKIHLNVRELEDSWELAIKDNGLGIPENQIEEIFKPFKRLHSWDKIKGSGLGLAICKKIVELHKGSLTVSSSPGQGSTFFIRLPKN
ncbi:ATP-binding protein [Legionella sp. km772]|uniref:sensor histidine kinase n=1 Tax=Legionella sp. km772 TaxID=2498111 RepID=UPI0013158FF5|nr:ATP-binding protein [Legionella sp. km772]